MLHIAYDAARKKRQLAQEARKVAMRSLELAEESLLFAQNLGDDPRAQTAIRFAEEVKAATEHTLAETESSYREAHAACLVSGRAYFKRVEQIKLRENKQRAGNAVQAKAVGVPVAYLNEVDVTISRGARNVYYGDTPYDRTTHGHIAVRVSDGVVTYSRRPYDPHGQQNWLVSRRRRRPSRPKRSRESGRPKAA